MTQQAAATGGSTSSATQLPAKANIPAWQNQMLNSLAQQGQLSGVPPQVLASIVQAESSGKGGGINSAGYGGYFGLSPNTAYGPTKLSVSNATLQSTTPQAFAQQAIVAAAAFANLLHNAKGNVYAAEAAYQTGSYSAGVTNGVKVFQGNGVPSSLSLTGVGGSSTPADLTGAALQSNGAAPVTSSSAGLNWLQQYANLMSPASGGILGMFTNPAQAFQVVIARAGTFLGGLLLALFGVLVIVGVPVLDVLRGKGKGAVAAVIAGA